jgi:hypothetical protein
VEKLSLTKKTALRRQIDRVWAPHLKPAEHKCLLFLFTVTTEWGKEADRVKRDHFVTGLKHAAGTGLCKRTVHTALASLSDRGVVWRKRGLYGYVYGINFDWTPDMPIPIPKKDRKPAEGLPQSRAQRCNPCTVKGANIAPAIEGEEHTLEGHTYHSRSPIGSGAGARLRSRPKAVQERPVQPDSISTALSRHEADVARANEKTRQSITRAAGKHNANTVENVWALAHRETFPAVVVPPWSTVSKGQSLHFVRSAARNVRGLEVLDWSVRNWRLIVNARFAWMNESPPPEFPNIGFMLKFKDHFYAGFNDRERLRSELTLSGRDRRVKRLQHQGLSAEEAEKEATARDAATREREAIAEDRKRLNDMLARVDRRANGRDPEKFQAPVQRRAARPAMRQIEQEDVTDWTPPEMPEIDLDDK